MKTLLLLILLIVPSAALAELTFDISCKNVERISITRISGAKHSSESYPSTFHIVYFGLKHSAMEKFSKLAKASRSFLIRQDGTGYDRAKLTITANGTPLHSDVPECDAHEDGEVGIMIIREQDAFDAARAVCPALTPAEMTTYGP
ncbi:MAG TPA: hypothetical protein VN419_05120 [Humidesulfovibrio sp.]|uniref:hypothetical protein n=1 Tax=Humidesulfovibrio sp. TaxID=2910988 RepID=UPI002C725E22|nr:hypothetical protein [Humidesulfovibrio sp.]HWR03381.1 hypothetical protein [Humidesulfovibrio sp.]